MVNEPTTTVAALCLTFVSLAVLTMAPGRAGATEPKSPKTTSDERVEEARRLFEEGKRLRDEGRLSAALEQFERSRALYPSFTNTKNVAVTLYKLGRHARALRLYQELLDRFGDPLEPEERRGIETSIRELAPLAAPEAAATQAKLEDLAPIAATAGAPVKAPPRARPSRAVRRVFRADLVAGLQVAPAPAAAFASPCESGALAPGGLVGARLGYAVHPFFTLEIGGGFLGLDASCAQKTTSTFGGPLPAAAAGSAEAAVLATYDVARDTTIRSGFVTAGASYRRPVAGSVHLLARTSVGVLRGHGSEAARVTVSTEGNAPVDFRRYAGGTDTSVTALLVSPELGVEVRLARLRLGLSLGATIFPVASGSFGTRKFIATSDPKCAAQDLVTGAPSCANALALTTSQILPPVTASPSLSVGYDF